MPNYHIIVSEHERNVLIHALEITDGDFLRMKIGKINQDALDACRMNICELRDRLKRAAQITIPPAMLGKTLTSCWHGIPLDETCKPCNRLSEGLI
jgi:hypothetical protein